MQTRSLFPEPASPTAPVSHPPESSTLAQAELAACLMSLRNGSRTFMAASLLLPRAVREPASVLYAFCRLADDAVDAPTEAEGRHNAVVSLRERLTAAYAGNPRDHVVDRALASVVARYGIPRALFDALIEGFEWDTEGRHYDTLAQLETYAARVAGSVGAMMSLLMGARTPEALARACDLGVAMQYSNIARDVGEDARMGRVYLPRDWLREAGLEPQHWLADPSFDPALGRVVERLLQVADALYARVGSGIACLPLACRPGINAARWMYAGIGHAVARRGFDSVTGRARVSAPRKAVVLLRSMAALAPASAHTALPPLPANRFLVDAAVSAPVPQRAPAQPRRSVGERLVWTAELFARLEQRDRLAG